MTIVITTLRLFVVFFLVNHVLAIFQARVIKSFFRIISRPMCSYNSDEMEVL